MDLDVSYELDETTVEPQEAAGEECGTDPDHQEEVQIIVAAHQPNQMTLYVEHYQLLPVLVQEQ